MGLVYKSKYMKYRKLGIMCAQSLNKCFLIISIYLSLLVLVSFFFFRVEDVHFTLTSINFLFFFPIDP